MTQDGIIEQPTHSEITLQEIKEAADKFFEYPTANKSHVSTTSMILFVEHMMNSTIADQIKCKKCVDAMLGKNESTASAAWSELDEKRLEIIGQNGNTGDHYE